MLNRAIKIILLLIMLAFITYLGACVYFNFFASKTPEAPKLPDMQEAVYSVTIDNTGVVMFTNKFDQYGQTYILHGYWEKSGNGFKFRDRDLILDQAVFGKITVRRR